MDFFKEYPESIKLIRIWFFIIHRIVQLIELGFNTFIFYWGRFIHVFSSMFLCDYDNQRLEA